MNVAPLLTTNTQRFLVRQQTNGGLHTTLFRAPNGVAPATVISEITAFLNQLRLSMWDTWSATGLDYAPAFSTVTTPQAWTPIVGSNTGVGRTDHQRDPIFISFIGRTSQGRRVKLTFFGSAFTPDQNYRVDVGQASNLTSCITLLNGSSAPISAIDGNKPLWKPYVDSGYNAYWQRKNRRTQAP